MIHEGSLVKILVENRADEDGPLMSRPVESGQENAKQRWWQASRTSVLHS